eukprot:5682046-Prorocentrum_lima.AAC.1
MQHGFVLNGAASRNGLVSALPTTPKARHMASHTRQKAWVQIVACYANVRGRMLDPQCHVFKAVR